jgi:hypothetical protein
MQLGYVTNVMFALENLRQSIYTRNWFSGKMILVANRMALVSRHRQKAIGIVY